MLADSLRLIVTSLVLGAILLVAIVHNHTQAFLKEFSSVKKSLEAEEFPRRKSSKKSSKKEDKVVRDVSYYCQVYNFHHEEHRAITKDGFFILLHRIVKKGEMGVGKGHPIILQHGLFMGAGVFVSNEETSLAFYLADKGYDVWLGNNRGNHLAHETHQKHHQQIWDWSVDDLARYDMPAMVDHVIRVTQQPQVTWVGHSQGNGQAFMALSTNPALNDKIKLFVALAPTARLGDLPSKPLKFLRKDYFFDLLMGDGQFIPMIYHTLVLSPASVFATLGYHMFFYLFKWSDTHWNKRCKPKYFQFSGFPVSCKQIRHWMKMTEKGAIFNLETGEFYPIEKITTPLAVFHGVSDELADADALYELFKSKPQLKVRHFEKIADYEHMDLIWATDSEEKVFNKIHNLIQEELKRD